MNTLFKQAEMPGIDHTPTIASNDSGSYRFEMQPNYAQPEDSNWAEKVVSDEEESKSSLYNLLDHSAADLYELFTAIEHRRLFVLENPTMKEPFAKLSAWSKLVGLAFNEKEKRESEAWAEQTAKEIKEAVK